MSDKFTRAEISGYAAWLIELIDDGTIAQVAHPESNLSVSRVIDFMRELGKLDSPIVEAIKADSVEKDSTQSQPTFTPLSADEVEFSCKIDYDQAPLEDSLISGDPEYLEAEKAEIAQLERRLETFDTWAWFVVRVFAKWNGFKDYVGVGGCSYEDKADFEGDLLPELKEEALDELNTKLKSQWEKLQARVK